MLQGARGGVDSSEVDQDHIRDVVDRYYEKMRESFDDESIIVPWAKSAEGLSMKHEGDLALTAIDAYRERVALLAELRLKEGRALSAANRKRLGQLVESMGAVITDLNDLLTSTEPKPRTNTWDALTDVAAFQPTIAQYGQE